MVELEAQVRQIFKNYNRIAIRIPSEGFFKSTREPSLNVETWPSGIVIYDVLGESGIEKGAMILPCPAKYNPQSLELALYENTGTLKIDPNTPQTRYTLTHEGKVLHNYNGEKVEVTGDTARDVTQFVSKVLDELPKALEKGYFVGEEESYSQVPSAPLRETQPYGDRIVGTAGFLVLLGVAAALILRYCRSPKR